LVGLTKMHLIIEIDVKSFFSCIKENRRTIMDYIHVLKLQISKLNYYNRKRYNAFIILIKNSCIKSETINAKEDLEYIK